MSVSSLPTFVYPTCDSAVSGAMCCHCKACLLLPCTCLLADLQAVVASSTFTQNVAGQSGGGISTSGKVNLTIQDSAFVRNGAATYGGAAYLDTHSQTTIHGCACTHNHARSGGGLLCGGCLLTTNSTSFTNNSAAQYGGVLYATDNAQVFPITSAQQEGCCMA